MIDFSKFLTDEMKKQNLSQRDLAEAAGVSSSSVHYYVHGGNPTLYNAEAICTALGIQIIIGGENENRDH